MPTTLEGLAHHLPPPRAVGAVRRPIATEPVGPSDIAQAPAREALRQAGMGVEDVELIIFATMTPDVTFPGSACYFQDKLGCGTVGALDIRGQCAGFLYGLMIADGFLAAGTYRRIVLAAGEVHSSGLDYSDRGLHIASLYGDGAAVVVLKNGRDTAGVRAVVCRADGRHHERFWCEHPASRQHPLRITVEDMRAGRHYPSLDVEAVAEFGRRHLPEVIGEALARAGAGRQDVDCFVLSHILPSVVESTAGALGVPSSRWIDAGAAHGHLTAASLPVALSEAVRTGRLGKGARVCLASCGAGFTWGAALLTL
jgi:3-oxoacyl-[acyl-carrier-protein] synthase-3